MDKIYIKRLLLNLADLKYKKFVSSLIPNVDKNTIIGVRLPILRKIAKKIAKNDWRYYLDNVSDDSFEEIMLYGMVIGYIDLKPDCILDLIKDFIPKINNWSTCDSFCSGLKFTLNYKENVWLFIQSYLKSDKEYFIRFGIVMLLYYYIDENYINEILYLIDDNYHNIDYYYVKMAIAWLISVCYIKFPGITKIYLSNSKLDNFTYNKSIQKISESLKVNIEDKNIIKSMKRK